MLKVPEKSLERRDEGSLGWAFRHTKRHRCDVLVPDGGNGNQAGRPPGHRRPGGSHDVREPVRVAGEDSSGRVFPSPLLVAVSKPD
ncbi:hypothetical protein SLITK23_58250 [Streptomyces lividans]|uniref:Uncharacterized protein n=1 Tax=Streptomyces lividans 1326 TaxID=1200984 RepID=A0A7U9HE82_STRLI|nr:hypothetical protein SLI_6287 [Streptomyces lividans 1326]BDE42580.1 hypothetical protein SLITK23_58250 [Streptomyces lividans]